MDEGEGLGTELHAIDRVLMPLHKLDAVSRLLYYTCITQISRFGWKKVGRVHALHYPKMVKSYLLLIGAAECLLSTAGVCEICSALTVLGTTQLVRCTWL